MKSGDNVLLLLVFKEINYLFSGIMISFMLLFCYLIIIIFLQSAQPLPGLGNCQLVCRWCTIGNQFDLSWCII